ncbi:putative two component transcriptional regulator, winged helix family [Rhodothermus marinus DSM 4252]|uniref:Putative two component transcriptional regulator, winged helix family n=1 Tax=Rhodothermus marinus (strain ATCC 43812 / DSM 4252 / R-10) TaxID=518766 RepID=D0MFI7_RHOM4|nr:putative two component transcriptional regulator, winged helix family [Rhodothermus marinus DSM 4252]AEN72548.1 transcriptional regulator, winged helix family [Rhodothermus marinus SG0.5JP17-172]MBO2492776.1 winged-helix domain-containing protein [Rhodothermus marinus]
MPSDVTGSTTTPPAAPLRLCLITDDPLLVTAVQLSCPPPHELWVFGWQALGGPQHTLSEQGQQLLEAARQASAVLVDWQLAQAPLINTLGFYLRRQATAPLIALCRTGPEAQIAALVAGADAALTFPLQPALIQAHQVAYQRLVRDLRLETTAATLPRDVRQVGRLRLDRTAHRFFIDDQEVEVTPREFALLDFLLSRPGVACSRHEILAHVWGITFDTGTNMVDVYMYFLRRKLEAHGLKNVIRTIRGYGYRLDLPAEPPEKTA